MSEGELFVFILIIFVIIAVLYFLEVQGIFYASMISSNLFLTFRYGAPALAAACVRFLRSSCSNISSLPIEDYHLVLFLGMGSVIVSTVLAWSAGIFIGTGIMTNKRPLGIIFLIFTIVTGIASEEFLVTPTLELLRNRWEAEGLGNNKKVSTLASVASYLWGSNDAANSWAMRNTTCFMEFGVFIFVCRVLIVVAFAGGLQKSLCPRVHNLANKVTAEDKANMNAPILIAEKVTRKRR